MTCTRKRKIVYISEAICTQKRKIGYIIIVTNSILIPYLEEQVHCLACCHGIGIDAQLSFGDSAPVSVEILYPRRVKRSRRSVFECHYIRRKSVTLTCCHKHLVNQLGAIHRRVVPIEGIVVRLV